MSQNITVELQSNGTTIVEEPKTISIAKNICNENLQHQEQSIQVSFNYSQQLFSLMAIGEEITAVVKDGSTVIFTGIVNEDVSWTDEGNPYPVHDIQMTIRDFTQKFDVTTEEEVGLIDTTLSAVVNQICEDCGVTVASSQIIPSAVEVEAFVLDKGSNYKTALDNILFQYGYSYFFNASGQFVYFNFFDIPDQMETLSEEEILNKPKFSRLNKNYNAVKLSYNKLTKRENELVYYEASGYDSNESVVPAVVQPGVYFPFNSAPEIEATDGQVYQDFQSGYAQTRKKYNGELEYQRSQKTTLLYTENHSIVEDWEGGSINVNRQQFGYRHASIRLQNIGNTDADVYSLSIRADAYYRDVEASVVVGEGKKYYTCQAEHIFNNSAAETLALILYRYFCGVKYKIQLSSEEEIVPGTYKVIDTGLSGFIISALAISSTYNPETELYSVTFISIGPAQVVQRDLKDQISSSQYNVKGDPGSAGPSGWNQTVIELFKPSADEPLLFPEAITYNFETGVLTCNNLNGWSQELPEVDENNLPVWVIRKAINTQNTSVTIATGAFDTPRKVYQSGYSKSQIMSWFEDTVQETPNVTADCYAAQINVDENGISPITQSFTVNYKVMQQNQELNFNFGQIYLPTGISVTVGNGSLTFTVSAGVKIRAAQIVIPIIYSYYDSYDYLVDESNNFFVILKDQDKADLGQCSTVATLPAAHNVGEHFKWIGAETASTEEIVEGAVFYSNTFYSWTGSRWSESKLNLLGYQTQASQQMTFNLPLSFEVVKGGSYLFGINAVADIPSEALIGDYFTWTGTNNTSFSKVEGGYLKQLKRYKYVGGSSQIVWQLDTASHHMAQSLPDVLSVANADLQQNASDVYEYFGHITANSAFFGQLVAQEAFIDQLVTKLIEADVVTTDYLEAGNAVVKGEIHAQSLYLGNQEITNIIQEQPDLSGYALKNSVLQSSKQIYYLSNSQTAPNAPSGEVTSTLNRGGAWRTVCPSYHINADGQTLNTFKYYYKATQSQINGNWQTSAITRDYSLEDSWEKALQGESAANTANNKNVPVEIIPIYKIKTVTYSTGNAPSVPTTPSKPTDISQVKDTAQTEDTYWSIVYPTVSTANNKTCFVYKCIQTKYYNASTTTYSYSWGSVERDYATEKLLAATLGKTIIVGGHLSTDLITAGLIDADMINVQSLKSKQGFFDDIEAKNVSLTGEIHATRGWLQAGIGISERLFNAENKTITQYYEMQSVLNNGLPNDFDCIIIILTHKNFMPNYNFAHGSIGMYIATKTVKQLNPRPTWMVQPVTQINNDVTVDSNGVITWDTREYPDGMISQCWFTMIPILDKNTLN